VARSGLVEALPSARCLSASSTTALAEPACSSLAPSSVDPVACVQSFALDFGEGESDVNNESFDLCFTLTEKKKKTENSTVDVAGLKVAACKHASASAVAGDCLNNISERAPSCVDVLDLSEVLLNFALSSYQQVNPGYWYDFESLEIVSSNFPSDCGTRRPFRSDGGEDVPKESCNTLSFPNKYLTLEIVDSVDSGAFGDPSFSKGISMDSEAFHDPFGSVFQRRFRSTRSRFGDCE
jgi:hypothetical protein